MNPFNKLNFQKHPIRIKGLQGWQEQSFNIADKGMLRLGGQGGIGLGETKKIIIHLELRDKLKNNHMEDM